MSEIGDEIRRRFDVSSDSEGVIFDRYGCEKMRELADRIDSEMVELPKGRDGVPIRVDDTVYTPSGLMATVTDVKFHVICLLHGGGSTSITFFPTDLTHDRPDSWESIADELEEWSEDNRINGDGEVFRRARDLAERIRRLAKEGE